VTPAHDPNDFAIGQRHKLPSISILDDTAHITVAGAYLGLDRYEARKRVLADLEAQGLLVAVKDHANSVGKCDRCKTVVEPRLSTQWFLKIQPLADKAIAAVEQGHIQFTPEQYKKTYFEWMHNIHDWCLSRQLWWGHRIPAWHCAACQQPTVARETPTACVHCGSNRLTQETDVLDTWFSSGLLPFTVFRWPDATADLAKFYPTQLLLTGFDILFFWVARMIMLGCYFMEKMPLPDGSPRPLKDSVPFRNVYIHALVRDAERQKMSKTKGNVLDPIDIIQRYGTDAVRFTLASMASPGTDIAFSEARTEGYRAFANKIWNAARFIFMQIDRAKEAGIVVDLQHLDAALQPPADAPLEARWIAWSFHRCAAEVSKSLTNYRFDDAANHIHRFFWGDFCDWYLEIVKIRLDFTKTDGVAAKTAALTTLLSVFEAALRLLSPFMPFITEEIWQALYESSPPEKSIALVNYPLNYEDKNDKRPQRRALDEYMGSLIENGTGVDMVYVQDLIGEIRNLRKDRQVPENLNATALIYAKEAVLPAFQNNIDIIQRLARVSEIRFADTKLHGATVRSTPKFDVDLDYEKPIDIPAERERLTKDLAKYEKEMAGKQSQLQNDGFLAKAPANIVEGLRTRANELTVLIEKTRAALDTLDAVGKK
jgi:valyl-tRNA synthetase